MAALASFLGDTLVSKDGTTSTTEAIGDAEYIGIYFSAHWCGPCRRFTPQLASAYKQLRDSGKKFEVVFVSADRDEASWRSYFDEMPWLAVPYEDRGKLQTLSRKYSIQGYPSLIVVDANGNTVNGDAVGDVARGGVKKFPWVPPTIWELIGDSVEGKGGAEVAVSSLRDKPFAIYFSAHWCPPCRNFTPVLVSCYKKLQADGKPFEVIFASNDQDEEQYEEYYGEMPWLTFGFEDDRTQELMGHFGLRGIPALLIFDGENDGQLITAQGVGSVASDADGSEFPWRPKPVNSLSQATNEDLNRKVCLVAMLAGADSPDEKIASMTEVAEARKAAGKDEVLFFYDKEGGELAMKLRTMFSVTETPGLVLLELPSYYNFPGNEVTADTISAFLEAYDAKALDASALG